MPSIQCEVHGSSFVLGDRELALYEKLQIPLPRRSPRERRRQRLVRRNDRKLHRRNCDSSGKFLISMYPAETPFPVIEKDIWWGDSWDAKSYGRPFDFSRSFFSQFAELQSVVPRPALNILNCENSDFVNQCGFSKNCYLTFNTDFSESCYYTSNVLNSRDCVDVYNVDHCELCYECVDCRNCYGSSYLVNCSNCFDSMLLRNCIGCRNCFGSVNLRNKEYYFFNRKVSRDEYERLVASWWSGSSARLNELLETFFATLPEQILPHAELVRCEEVVGDHLRDCRHVHESFDTSACEDTFNCTVLSDARDVADYDIGGYGAERCIQVMGSGKNIYDCYYCSNLWVGVQNTYYSDIMQNVQHCFGCVGMRNAKFCVLNQQYSEAEYFELRDRIVAHMKRTGEWGQYFPEDLSPFAYNHSTAAEVEPMTKEEAGVRGFRWFDDAASSTPPDDTLFLADSIHDVDESIVESTQFCHHTGKAFRFQRAEVRFYQRMNLPLPRYCPEERHRRRLRARNPYQLWKRDCAVCGTEVFTSFSPDRPQRIACKPCYEREVVH